MANTHSIDLESSSSQYLSIAGADQTGLNITGDITIEWWQKLEQLPSTAETTFLYLSKDGVNATEPRCWSIDSNGNGMLDGVRMYIFNGANSSYWISADDIVEAGTWAHFAITVDVSGPTAILYKNGSAITFTRLGSAATAIGSSTTTDVIIGARQTGVLPTDGLMDEVRIWNDIRTSTEIADNYDKELVGDEAGLQAYWKLNNGLLDETSNNNDLTNNNSATFSTDVPFVYPPVPATGNSNFFMFMN